MGATVRCNSAGPVDHTIARSSPVRGTVRRLCYRKTSEAECERLPRHYGRSDRRPRIGGKHQRTHCEHLTRHFQRPDRRPPIGGKRQRTHATADVRYPTASTAWMLDGKHPACLQPVARRFPARLGPGCRAENIRPLARSRPKDATSYQRTSAGPPLGFADENEASWRHDRR